MPVKVHANDVRFGEPFVPVFFHPLPVGALHADEDYYERFMFTSAMRLPKPVGQAAVEAGIVSAPMVIVVSITGIASFTIPAFNLAIGVRLLRFPMILLAGALGLYGITLGLLALLIHLASLRSFGVPMLVGISPPQPGNLKDVLLRMPWWNMTYRPVFIGRRRSMRVPPGQRPSAKRSKGET
ncbi:MAG TPA: spore germination protein [Bacilli bacterium]|nr:spore germination protein [Bacilli bacterium]